MLFHMRLVVPVFLAAAFCSLQAQPLAPLPPMGWNSWDSYGLTVTESEFRANAEVLARDFKPHGWRYAVVDEGWYLPNPEAKPESFRFTMDANGRYMPALNRFPSADSRAGLKPLADFLHGLGLQLGIHIIRGIPKQAVARNLPIADSVFHAADAADRSDTCPWNKDNFGVRDTPAGQAYYDSLAKLYAGWNVDFIKVDCIAHEPYKAAEIRMYSQALHKTGRPIVLSLSPGPAPLDKVAELAEYAQMWRISNDVWDQWKPRDDKDWRESLYGQFANADRWASHVVSGHWPDADMLPLGYLGPHPGEGVQRQSSFTHDEQRTLLTLWSMLRSPLILGCNLTRLDAWTGSLLTNDEVIAVNQHSEGGRQISNDGTTVVWAAKSGDAKSLYVAVFNVSDTAHNAAVPLQSLGLPAASYRVRDVWERKDLGTADRLEKTLQPHASMLVRVEPKP